MAEQTQNERQEVIRKMTSECTTVELVRGVGKQDPSKVYYAVKVSGNNIPSPLFYTSQYEDWAVRLFQGFLAVYISEGLPFANE